jgi:hypothetical protein
MGDAAALAEVLQRLVTPAPPREWMPLDVEAKARGKTTSALREWCERNGVQIRQQNHRDAWVRPADIDAAVERMPPAKLQAPSPTKRQPSEIDAEIEKKRR